MGQHLELAQQFIEEQRQQYPNLVGALLVGSAAQGAETAFSDVDLRLIVQAEPDALLNRHGIDVWRNGIYIDALPVAWADYTDLERILTHPIRANDMNSGLILYDPTGRLAQMQHETQALFMASSYVARRVQSLAERVTPWLGGLQQAIAANDSLSICVYTGRLVFGLALIPLIGHGVAPSSTRHLRQVGQLAPRLCDQLCEIEGATQMEQVTVLECHRIFTELSAACDTTKWGNLPAYVVKKTEWMIHNDYQREAVHTMWINTSFRANDCLQSRDSQTAATTERLAQSWLAVVRWTDQAVHHAKWQQINFIWTEVRASLAHLLPLG